MRKLFNVITITVTSVVIASIYGIVHDQLTYTISPEYYTKFKFIQFGLKETPDFNFHPRILVSLTGWMATWWVGLIIGFILSLFILPLKHNVYKIALKAIFVVLAISFLTGFAGLITGYIFGSDTSLSAEGYFPEDEVDGKHFTAVGFMHTFGYIGGLIGLFIGILYIRHYRKSVIKK